MKVVSSEEVHSALAYPAFVDALQEGFGGEFTMPPRQVFGLDADPGNHDAFALLPAWNRSIIGVKAFTYFPENEAPDYKSLYSKILLFDRAHGEPLALVDGTSVTFWRTAGVSALASRLLSREDARTLLVLGTGNLAPYLIRAHASVRPLERIMVWGRNPEKAEAVAAAASSGGPAVVAVSEIEPSCREADIIVSATGSGEPLVLGDWVKPGTHTDFLGNHHADKRECDSTLVTHAKVYVDSRANCLREAGEILLPIEEGVFTEAGIVGELSEMCSGSVPLRTSPDEVTLFKSVGTALGDLIGASMAYRASIGIP